MGSGWSEVERRILDRYAEKSRLAGGARGGLMLRRDSVAYHAERHPDLDFDAGLSSLVEKGVLAPNEGGDRFALTEDGAGILGAPERP